MKMEQGAVTLSSCHLVIFRGDPDARVSTLMDENDSRRPGPHGKVAAIRWLEDEG
jgi:hypothetical protein